MWVPVSVAAQRHRLLENKVLNAARGRLQAGMSRHAATIVRSGLCRTTAAHRPAPSLFVYPGLTSRPWWDPSEFPWLERLTEHLPTIQKEYAALAAELPDDYTVKEGEHTVRGPGGANVL
jgi:hypothetical protein